MNTNITHLRRELLKNVIKKGYMGDEPKDYQRRAEGFATYGRGYLPEAMAVQDGEIGLLIKLAEMEMGWRKCPSLSTKFFVVSNGQRELVVQYGIEKSYPYFHGGSQAKEEPFISERVHVLRAKDLGQVASEDNMYNQHDCGAVISLKNGKVVSVHDALSKEKDIALYGVAQDNEPVFRVYEREENEQPTGFYCSTNDCMWMGTLNTRRDVPEQHGKFIKTAQIFADKVKKEAVAYLEKAQRRVF